jgi:hypothetical protein
VDLVTFVPRGDGRRAQVNLLLFGPFGEVDLDEA